MDRLIEIHPPPTIYHPPNITMPDPSSRPLIAGIDIGGTNVRCALAERDAPGQILVRRRTRTPQSGVEPVLDVIVEEMTHCLHEAGRDRDELAAVGCVAPGITDAARGVVVEVANLPGWQHVPLTSLLERRFERPVVIANDVNAAALGEFAYGAGRDCHSLVYLTISTGVAAGIVVEGRLLRGYHHAAGELGYFIPDPVHLGKNWDPSGCLELTSAGIGLAQAWADLRGGPATSDRAIEVFDAARAGDADAEALVRRAADYLAQAAIAIGNLIDPERLVLGGSIAQHEARIANRIRDVVETTLLFPPEVVHAALGDDAPLIGALTLAARTTS